jgi:uncharacterized protein YndB with AHSA1/START domain
MENIDWTQFSKKIAVKANIKTIYNAWTIPNETEKWFLFKALFFDNNSTLTDKNKNFKKGDNYEWSWYLYDGLEKGTILDTNNRNQIKFTFAGDCIVDIHLKEFKDYTIVELTQKNIPTDDNSKKNIRLGCETGWSFYLVNLKSVYEGGLDLRNKDTELKAMLNN